MTRATKAAAALASLFPIRVVVEAEPPLRASELDLFGDPYPEERRYIEAAADKRRAEFVTGRGCARRALARLGVGPCAVPPGANRAPIWPAGIVGSISHTADLCVAAVALSSDVASIGIDIEGAEPLGADLLPVVCTPRELAWLATLSDDERGRWAKRLFGAKEAFFKCQFVRTQAMLDFQDVEIDGSVTTNTLAARLLPPALQGMDDMRGLWIEQGTHLLTAAWLPR